jgi:hypothetical protein
VKTSLPILLVWTGADKYQWSPSAIDNYIDCARKWAWRRIAGHESPSSASADLGKRTHTVLEAYLGEGKMPDRIADPDAARVASSGLHLLPRPKQEGMQLERHFRFKSSNTGHVYHGFKDVQIMPGSPVEALGLDGSAPIIIDHKTTSSIDSWAKKEDDLFYDAQAVLYGLDSMARFASDAADLSWNYLQTKNARNGLARPTTTRLHAPHALEVFSAIEDVVTEAASILDRGLQPLDLPPNTSACKKYGGCPYEHLCNLSPSQKVRSRMSANSIIAGLRARVQGNPAVEDKPSEPATGINPPESETAPEPVTASAPVEEKVEEKPRRVRRTNAQIAADEAAKAAGKKDPAGADVHAHTTPAPTETQERRIEAPAHVASGFTLYVDCIPCGRTARSAHFLIEKAQERILKDHGVPDYRLLDFGKGVPFFVAAVDEQVDGTFDLMLDTRTPEGAVLLETLAAKASLVVRGLR